jgi:DNA repair photolyase
VQFRWEQLTAGSDGLFEPSRRLTGVGEYRGLTFHEVEARTIINQAPPNTPWFRYTINAYRGCSHACVYCFARPSHEYLGFGIGDDFDRKIVVKVNAVELARAETDPGRWGGESIAMGTNTDPYQPAEGKYRLTRGIVEVLAERRNPFSILTKSTLALRDLDLLAEAAKHAEVSVSYSIGTLDAKVWRETEPGTPHPMRRMEAVGRLNAAGVPSGVMIAPVLPGLSDHPSQIAAVEEAAASAGATFTSIVPLHLRKGVKDHYLGWLSRQHPELVGRYQELYRGRAYLRSGRRAVGPAKVSTRQQSLPI